MIAPEQQARPRARHPQHDSSLSQLRALEHLYSRRAQASGRKRTLRGARRICDVSGCRRCVCARAVEKHLAVLRAHPEVAVVQSCLEYWHSWREDAQAPADSRDWPPPVALRSVIQPPTLFALMLRSEGATVPGVCSLTIRREMLVSLGGFEDAFRSTYEDQVMLAKVYLTQKVYVLDECLARYRQHAGSSLHLAGSADDYTPGRPHAGGGCIWIGWRDICGGVG